MQAKGALTDYAAAGIAVVAISPDSVADLAELSAEHGITYPLLPDADAPSRYEDIVGYADSLYSDQRKPPRPRLPPQVHHVPVGTGRVRRVRKQAHMLRPGAGRQFAGSLPRRSDAICGDQRLSG